MLSLAQCRKADPSLADLSEEELLHLRDELYQLGGLALESYAKEKIEFPTSHLVYRQEASKQ